MRTFYVGDTTPANLCNTCCCESVLARRPELDLFQALFAAWIVPLGNGTRLTGRVEFDIKRIVSVPPANISGIGVLTAIDAQQLVVTNTPDVLDLATLVSAFQPPYTIEIEALGGPANGTADLVGTTLTYVPNTGFKGIDRLYYTVTETDTGRTVTAEVSYRVGDVPVVVAPNFDAVYVDVAKLKVNPVIHTTTFPVAVTPKARLGEAYRLTMRQYTIDCDGNELFKDVCFDIAIGKC